MKLVKPSFEILEQGPGLEGIYEAIERAGRTCYKSERKEGTTAKDFVDRMISSKHYAMLEHGTVYLKAKEVIDLDTLGDMITSPLDHYKHNKYSLFVRSSCEVLVTTNLRVLVENEWLDDLQYLCEPTEFHEKRVCVKFITDRGVSHEFVRHRVLSFAQESTRYCNYSKDRFGGEITFTIPSWMSGAPEGRIEWCGKDPMIVINGERLNYLSLTESTGAYDALLAWAESEYRYVCLLNNGLTAQQARQVLPNALKTELVMTGFISDWRHFFDLRAIGTTGKPHPDAKALADPLMEEFKNRNII